MSTNIWGERFFGAAFILLALFMGHRAWQFPAGGAMFPLFVSALMILVAGIMLARTFVSPDDYRQGLQIAVTAATFKPLALTLLVVVYVLATFQLGYYATTLLFLLVLPVVLGLRRPVFIVAAAVGATAFIYALFELALHAGMPSGILF